MKLSHSKLSTILSCSMTYYLQYKVGIMPKEKKKALSVGSAVHSGLEFNSDNLDKYFIENDDYVVGTEYTRDQCLAQAMVHGYLKMKDKIYDELLTDTDGTKATILDEQHELYLEGQLKSFRYPEPHKFIGIIDLLILTDKGFIIADYKTSSYIADIEDYIDQIYRYVFLVNSVFPGVPIYKLAIINLRKSQTRIRRGESSASYLKRMKDEYSVNDGEYINVYTYEKSRFDTDKFEAYMRSLSRDADNAQAIDMNNVWIINWQNVTNKYGKSQYYDIFYKTPDCYVMYNISDNVYNQQTKELMKIRSCKPLDMLVVERDDVLNKYEMFKAQALAFYAVSNDIDKDKLFEHLKKNFVTDDDLLEKYWLTLYHEMNTDNQNV